MFSFQSLRFLPSSRRNWLIVLIISVPLIVFVLLLILKRSPMSLNQDAEVYPVSEDLAGDASADAYSADLMADSAELDSLRADSTAEVDAVHQSFELDLLRTKTNEGDEAPIQKQLMDLDEQANTNK